MAQCVYCKVSNAELYEYGSPICLKCAELTGDHSEGVQTALIKAISEAKLKADSANVELTALINDIPSGLPPPDGVQRLHNASAKVVVARHRLKEAHTRLTDYLDRGIVPDDLKRSG